MKKHFHNLIPRLARKIAWARWRNNPPALIPHDPEDATKAFLLNKYVKHWWKECGGHKNVWNKLKDL